MKNRRRSYYLILLMPVLYALAAYGIAVLVGNSGVYPSGKDTLGHLYQADVLYQAMQKGTYWPAYDSLWYNGMEMMRYCAPIPLYLLAGCQYIGGSSMAGFLIFVMVLCFGGAISWLYVGFQLERPCFGAFLGILWFFMPNNLSTLFYEGDLAKSVCIAVLPLFMYWVYDYLKNSHWRLLPKISLCFTGFVLCHAGYAGMILAAFAVYFIVNMVIYHEYRRQLHAFLAMALGVLLSGFWLIPSLTGGVTAANSLENLADFFQNMFLSINPAARMHRGCVDAYFGLAAASLAVFGIFLSKKKSMSGFWTGLLILAFSSETFYLLVKILPGGEYFQMLRFISIGLCMILFGFLAWDTLKRGWILLFAGLLILDTLPSLPLILGNRSGAAPEERMAYYSEAALIGEAKEMTEQRLALLDESSLGSMSAYLVTGYGKPAATSYGAAEEAAATVTNFKQIDRALEEGNYLYLFDRCMELGNDTVVIQLDFISNPRKHPVRQMDTAAERVGYELMDFNENYRFYKLAAAEGNWGTKADYRAVGIGEAAPGISRQFPVVEETESGNLNDYTFEDLEKYDLIYLAGFTYDDKKYAEKLVTDLSEAGVRIVIAADGIPDDRGSREQSFLGAVCHDISFSQGYPQLDTVDGILDTDLFPNGHREWSTVYINGLKDVWGKVEDGGLELPFFGTVKNDNIVMIGLNLTYYYSLTQDEGVGNLLSRAMDLSSDELPGREIIPYAVQYKEDSITLTAGEDDLNTGLAWHDSFASNREIYGKNHLTYVSSGTTVISFIHPYRKEGIMASLAGAALLLAFTLYRRKQSGKTGKESGVIQC